MTAHSVEPRGQSFTVALSPNRCCWQCESPLPHQVFGVKAHRPPLRVIFVLCSLTCQGSVLREMQCASVEAHAVTPEVLELLLASPQNTIGVIEAQMLGDEVLWVTTLDGLPKKERGAAQ